MPRGLDGGFHYLQSFRRTVMDESMGGRTRLVTLVGGAKFIVLPLMCSSLLKYVPTTFLGGLLLCLGLSALVEWVYRARKKLSTIDYGLVQFIWLVSAIVGFLQGLALGWVIAFAMVAYQNIKRFTSNA